MSRDEVKLFVALGVAGAALYLSQRRQIAAIKSTSKCDKLGCNIIANHWGVDPLHLWAIFGVESSYGADVSVGTSGERGPMQILPATEVALRQRYPELAAKSVETCEGAFSFGAAHIATTAALRGWAKNDLRNIVAYNEGHFGSHLRTLGWGDLDLLLFTGLPSGIPYFEKWRERYEKIKEGAE